MASNNPNVKANLKPFVKGDPRINRKGKTALPDLKQCISDNVDMNELIRTLQKLAKSGNVRAIQELLDRGYGKPHQSTDTKITMSEDIEGAAKTFIETMKNI